MIWLDLETWNELPINHGTYRYADTADVMLFAYAIDNQPAQVWDLTTGAGMPGDLAMALDDESEPITAHNVTFDRSILNRCRNLKLQLPLPRWRCNMVQAMAHSLPGSLATLCEIMKIPQDQAKEKDGRTLVRLFCQPLPKNSKLRRATRETHPEQWTRFVDYARLDVEAMRAINKKLPKWNYQGEELALWRLDQTINDRGVCVDTLLAEAAIGAVGRAQHTLAARTQQLTSGDVQAATQRDALLRHLLSEYGVALPDLQADTLERRVSDPDLPAEVRELIGIRLQASTSSTSKYNSLVRGVNADGRLRGTLQFCGAIRTGRWAGRMFQPQNLPRTSLPQAEIDTGIEAIKLGCEDILTGNVMELCSNAIRGSIVAPSGKKLVVADLSNIEGRVGAWLAGEEWKLQAFRDFDAGTGHDLYKLAYAKSFAVDPVRVTKEQRQIGKVEELMLQYEGGVGAFLTGAATYSIDLEDMATKALPTIPEDVVDQAAGFWAWRIDQGLGDFGLGKRVFTACDALKRLWRGAHPNITQLWPELQSAACSAVLRPGVVFQAGERLSFDRTGAWLRMRLPSGRYLCYPAPLVDGEGKLSYMGVNQYSRKWSRLKTYGGKLMENACQAVARDVMAGAMPTVQNTGFQIVLTVHDEIITEAPDEPLYSVDALSALMASNSEWNEGLPLAAGGFETYRYRKA